MKTVLPFRVVIPIALTAGALLSGPVSAQPAAAPATAMPESGVTLTREDVVRDLAAWRNSGLENQWDREESPDINSPEYVADYRKYMETSRQDGATPSSSHMQSEPQRSW